MKSRIDRKMVSVWQNISKVTTMFIAVCSAVIVMLQSIDESLKIFSYCSFMFDFLDVYSNAFTLVLFDFGTLIISLAADSLWLNILITCISLAFCVALAFSSLMISKSDAKIGITIWIIVIVLELLISLFIMASYIFFVIVFIIRAIMLFCLIMSSRYININYEYYDY